jgi:hypothetical protein
LIGGGARAALDRHNFPEVVASAGFGDHEFREVVTIMTAITMWCDRCGGALADGGHEVCAAARGLEPPRYCGQCRRRMTVQVLPAGWRATCVEHGDLTPPG